MISSPLQFFFIFALSVTAAAAVELKPGKIYRFTFTDIDRNQISTFDGHVTIITIVNRRNEQKARQLADRVPDQCIGDPKYRFATIVNFQKKITPLLRPLTIALVRRRLDREANRMKPRYLAKKLSNNPRRDAIAVTDFDGKTVSQFGIAPESDAFRAFVFDGTGRLLRSWSDVPSAEAVSAALREAQ